MLYARALEAVGLEALLVAPPEGRPLAELGVAGLLLSGGADIDPGLYGQALAPESDRQDRQRDDMEKRLLGEALETNTPVLGICRGMQFLNVALDGNLVQHHPNQAMHRLRTPDDPSLPAHEVFVRPGSKLAGILDAGTCRVNSRHHQAAARVADGLVVSACATDGLVEGLERPDKAFVVAVQWHPEDMVNDAKQRRLFEAFREAIAGGGGSAR
jgi:putative glutamine amidotransferase